MSDVTVSASEFYTLSSEALRGLVAVIDVRIRALCRAEAGVERVGWHGEPVPITWPGTEAPMVVTRYSALSWGVHIDPQHELEVCSVAQELASLARLRSAATDTSEHLRQRTAARIADELAEEMASQAAAVPVWRRFPGNIEWRKALTSGLPIVNHPHVWTCGDAVVCWSSTDAREAHAALRRVAVAPQ